MSRSNCRACLAVLLTLAASAALAAAAAPKSQESNTSAEANQGETHHFEPFKAESVTSRIAQ